MHHLVTLRCPRLVASMLVGALGAGCEGFQSLLKPGEAEEAAAGGDGADDAGDGGGSSDGDDADGGDGSGSRCGRSTATRFYVARFQLLLDPVDFDRASWDWDGDGIADFVDEYGVYLELAAIYFGYGAAYEVADLLVPLVDEAAPVLASPYVSPDPMSLWFYWDGAEFSESLAEDWHEDDQNLVAYTDLEINLRRADEALLIEVYDRDLAFDDYAGWDYLDRDFLRAVADCGPYTYLYTDREMARGETRVRAIGIEVESW